jgi:hypothetical protein
MTCFGMKKKGQVTPAQGDLPAHTNIVQTDSTQKPVSN